MSDNSIQDISVLISGAIFGRNDLEKTPFPILITKKKDKKKHFFYFTSVLLFGTMVPYKKLLRGESESFSYSFLNGGYVK